MAKTSSRRSRRAERSHVSNFLQRPCVPEISRVDRLNMWEFRLHVAREPCVRQPGDTYTRAQLAEESPKLVLLSPDALPEV